MNDNSEVICLFEYYPYEGDVLLGIFELKAEAELKAKLDLINDYSRIMSEKVSQLEDELQNQKITGEEYARQFELIMDEIHRGPTIVIGDGIECKACWTNDQPFYFSKFKVSSLG